MSTPSWSEWLTKMPQAESKNDQALQNAVKQSLSPILELNATISKKDQMITQLKRQLETEQFMKNRIQMAKEKLERRVVKQGKQMVQLKQHEVTIAKLTKLNQELRKVKESAIINYSHAAAEVHLLLDLIWNMYGSYNVMIDELKKNCPEWTEDDKSCKDLIQWIDCKNTDVIGSVVDELEEKHHEQSDYTVCMTHTFTQEKNRAEMGEPFGKKNTKRNEFF